MAKREPVFLPLPLQRLFDLYFLVDGNKEIDAEARADIARALFFYHHELHSRIAGTVTGRRHAKSTWALAFAAQILHRDYGATVKAAIAALLPRGNASDIERVATAYRKLAHKRGNLPKMISVEQKTIDAALARLTKPRKSGNK